MLATLYPATAPQDQRTITLVSTLRDSLIPRAEHDSILVAHVGGQTATAIDFAHVLGSKLPLFVGVVVILAFILLAAVFRSLLIPLVASVLNLISVVAALGAITAVFTRGWGSSLLGLSGTGPMDAFLPGGHHLLQEFGFGLGFSVLVDALLIRSMLLPAVKHLIGPANWHLPASPAPFPSSTSEQSKRKPRHPPVIASRPGRGHKSRRGHGRDALLNSERVPARYGQGSS